MSWNKFFALICLFIAALFLSIGVFSHAVLSKPDVDTGKLKAECEATLPRNQKCKIIAIPEEVTE